LISPENITLQKAGAMEYSVEYGIYPPWVPIPQVNPLLSRSKAYGLIWRVSFNNSEVQYIPQHLPIFLLDQENELFRAGPNLLAIRSLQCQYRKVEFAIVDENGISSFTTASESTCFKGSWFPRPPGGFSTSFGFLQSTSDLVIDFKATELSPDDSLVEEYRVQILSGYQVRSPVKECEAVGSYGQLIIDEKLERTGNGSLVLQVKNESSVRRFFPVYWKSCSYLILVYATPQRLLTESGRTIYPSADAYKVLVPFPDYDYIVLDANYTLERNNVTGRADVYIHVLVTSHWTSLAVLSKLGGILCFARSCGSPHSSWRNFTSTTAANSSFDITYHSVIPHQPGDDKLYSWVPEFHYRYPEGGVQFEPNFTLEVPIYALPPGPVRNFSVIEQFNDLSNQLILNVSWMRPEYPQGNVKFYHLLVSSANVLSIDEEKIFPPDHGEDVVFEHQFVIDLAVDESTNVSIQTETEHGMKGDWQVFPIRNYFTVMPTQPSQPILWYLYLIAGVFVVTFIILIIIAVICIYYYYKKNKVVIGTNTSIFIGGTRVVEEGMEDDDVFQPVMVDSWEISPDYIIMDCMLGEGQFGQVYKGMIKGIVNNPYFKGSQASFVAVKILRGEASASLKSDFLKEIATMKTITKENCPNVVNMVGCCTLQEPLALVQEYAPHGDLLTYLRTVRKLNSTTYYSVTSPTYLNREKGDKNVNRVTSPTTPITPMTPASTCPLVIEKDCCPPVPEHRSLPPHDGPIPSPYEKPYSSLGELKPAHLISFAHQIANGMTFLSDLGIVHRDLACRNILVGENKTLKISDFGLARENDIYIKTTDGRLPVRWMAIESITDRVYTTKSDVWAFGIVLWEIATLGGHPYSDIGNKALLHRLCQGYRMQQPPNCSDEIYEIMLECWNQHPSRRPTFADLVARFETLVNNSENDNLTYIKVDTAGMLPYTTMESIRNTSESTEGGSNADRKESVSDPFAHYDGLQRGNQKVIADTPYFDQLVGNKREDAESDAPYFDQLVGKGKHRGNPSQSVPSTSSQKSDSKPETGNGDVTYFDHLKKEPTLSNSKVIHHANGNPGNHDPYFDKLQEKRQLDRERSAGNGQVREAEKAVNESDSDQNSISNDRIPSVAPATNVQ
jgi:serine/threonine protein kinase